MSDKLITFCIPSYNSEAFLYHALDSLIPGGEKIEVLIIDDGSKDNTLKIAKEYEEKYPAIFKAVHQENKGHGGAINTALSLATGKFFKVLDSDDWVDQKGLETLLDYIDCLKQGYDVDLILMPYRYVHSYDEDGKGKLIKYDSFITPNKVIDWSGVTRFDYAHNFTLHSVIYKTEMLRANKIILPEHCFYEDNYFIYAPLPYVKHLIYLNEELYQYLLGRDGQSMQTANLIKRTENLERVAKLAFDSVDLESVKKKDKHLFHILRHQLCMMVTAPLMYVTYKDKKVCKKEKREFKESLKQSNPKQYKMIIYRFQVYGPSINNWIGKLFSRFFLWTARKYGSLN